MFFFSLLDESLSVVLLLGSAKNAVGRDTARGRRSRARRARPTSLPSRSRLCFSLLFFAAQRTALRHLHGSHIQRRRRARARAPLGIDSNHEVKCKLATRVVYNYVKRFRSPSIKSLACVCLVIGSIAASLVALLFNVSASAYNYPGGVAFSQLHDHISLHGLLTSRRFSLFSFFIFFLS